MFRDLWYRALASNRGIALRFEGSRQLVLSKLYAARRAAKDPALASLSIITPPIDGELWIVKREREAINVSP